MAYPRREILKRGAAAVGAALVTRGTASAQAQTAAVRMAQTPALDIAYEETGNAQGFPVILLHGFPDDVRAYDEVVGPLAKQGYRAIVPYLRGYGPTRFRDGSAPRMAEQAAIGQDVIDLVDALKIQRFAVAGYDWGGRAACIAAALHPERVRAAVLISGYTIQNVFATPQPAPPERERALWYQYLLQHRARPRRARAQSARDLQVPLGDLVADMEIHDRDLRTDGRILRQPRLRGRGRSLIPTPHRKRAR